MKVSARLQNPDIKIEAKEIKNANAIGRDVPNAVAQASDTSNTLDHSKHTSGTSPTVDNGMAFEDVPQNRSRSQMEFLRRLDLCRETAGISDTNFERFLQVLGTVEDLSEIRALPRGLDALKESVEHLRAGRQ
ncbi:hypothetical protein N7535_003747 [Penicillium sp. DV-2018c]|nr:hypothetical protein N7535_003747 [Penicillium sp. DV-2018c]